MPETRYENYLHADKILSYQKKEDGLIVDGERDFQGVQQESEFIWTRISHLLKGDKQEYSKRRPGRRIEDPRTGGSTMEQSDCEMRGAPLEALARRFSQDQKCHRGGGEAPQIHPGTSRQSDGQKDSGNPSRTS
jgi:hypothetical protein